MSYRNYVIAAYAVFAAMLLWDFLAPKLQLSQALRAIRLQRAQPEPEQQHADATHESARPPAGDSERNGQHRAPR